MHSSFRAIFRWLTVKDLNKMEIDAGVNPESPLGLLRGIKYGTESYHDLFKRLCRYGHFQAVVTTVHIGSSVGMLAQNETL